MADTDHDLTYVRSSIDSLFPPRENNNAGALRVLINNSPLNGSYDPDLAQQLRLQIEGLTNSDVSDNLPLILEGAVHLGQYVAQTEQPDEGSRGIHTFASDTAIASVNTLLEVEQGLNPSEERSATIYLLHLQKAKLHLERVEVGYLSSREDRYEQLRLAISHARTAKIYEMGQATLSESLANRYSEGFVVWAQAIKLMPSVLAEHEFEYLDAQRLAAERVDDLKSVLALPSETSTDEVVAHMSELWSAGRTIEYQGNIREALIRRYRRELDREVRAQNRSTTGSTDDPLVASRKWALSDAMLGYEKPTDKTDGDKLVISEAGEVAEDQSADTRSQAENLAYNIQVMLSQGDIEGASRLLHAEGVALPQSTLIGKLFRRSNGGGLESALREAAVTTWIEEGRLELRRAPFVTNSQNHVASVRGAIRRVMEYALDTDRGVPQEELVGLSLFIDVESEVYGVQNGRWHRLRQRIGRGNGALVPSADADYEQKLLIQPRVAFLEAYRAPRGQRGYLIQQAQGSLEGILEGVKDDPGIIQEALVLQKRLEILDLMEEVSTGQPERWPNLVAMMRQGRMSADKILAELDRVPNEIRDERYSIEYAVALGDRGLELKRQGDIATAMPYIRDAYDNLLHSRSRMIPGELLRAAEDLGILGR